MKDYLYPLFIGVILLLASSCASTKYLSIDVLNPAKVSFPADVVNVAIVDNAGMVLPDSIRESTTTDEEFYTSMSKEVLKASLAQFMNEEKFFNDVKVYPSPLRVDKNYGRMLPLSKESIRIIAKEMDAEALVSIDAYEAVKGKALASIDGFVFPVNQVRNGILFRVYDANGGAISPNLMTSDSLQWTGYEDEGEREFYKMMALQMSEGMTKQIVPYWESQERRYFVDGTQPMKMANKEVEKGNWTEAAKIWGAAFENSNLKDKQKAKIAANIALANENLGDIPNATTWVRIASNLINTNSKYSEEYQYINWYKIKLLERERDNPKVIEQMGVEEESEALAPDHFFE